MKTIHIKREQPSGMKYVTFGMLCILLTSCAGINMYSRTDQSGSQDTMVAGREYDDAGHYIVAALRSGNAEAFNKAMHKKALLDRTFEGMNQESPETKKVRSNLYSSLDEAGIVMARNLSRGVRLTYVRSRVINGEHRALVRVNMGDRGLSYLDFILGKDEGDAVRIIDWHDFAQGQRYTDSLRQALILMLPQNEMLIRRLLGMPAVDKKTVEQFSALASLSRDNKYEKWLETYSDLPEKLKYSRIVLVTRALITSAMENGNEYRLALQDVSRYIGDDPSLSLMLLDHYLLERDFTAAHRALDRLDEYTGGDAAVDFLKANICLAEKNYPRSIRHAQMAVKKDADFEDAYLTLFVASVYSKQYETAVHILSHLEHNFGYEFEPAKIAGISGYEEFSRSLIFAAWIADRTSSVER